MRYQQQRALFDPSALGQQYNLGNFQTQHEGTSSMLMLIATLIFCGFVIIPGVGFFTSGFFASGWNLVTGCVFGVLALLFISGLLGLKVFLSEFLYERRHGQFNVLVYDEGFLYWRSKGMVERAIRWEEIESVHHRVSKRSDDGHSYYDHTYSITTTHGEDVLLREWVLSDPQNFTRTVELATSNYLYSRDQAAYLAGRVVPFGRLGVSLQGLNYKAKMLFWNEVEHISLNEFDGTVKIKKKGRRRTWARFALGDLNNVKVLERLITVDIQPVHGFGCMFKP